MLVASKIDKTQIKIELVDEHDVNALSSIDAIFKKLRKTNIVYQEGLSWKMHVSLIPLIQRELNLINYKKRVLEPELAELLRCYREPQYDIDFDISIPLRDFQKDGVAFLLSRDFAVLGDDQGLGKTPQAIVATFKRWIDNVDANPNWRALFVTPNSVVYKWQREFAKFLGVDKSVVDVITNANIPKLIVKCKLYSDKYSRRKKSCKECKHRGECEAAYNKISAMRGKERRRLLYQQFRPFDIITYDLLRADSEWLSFHGPKYNGIIIDEVHRLRNINTQQSQALKNLAEKADFVYGLSGTLIQGYFIHIYTVLTSIDRRFFGSQKNFNERYLKYNRYGEVVGYKNEEEIKIRLPFIVKRRLKSEVAHELPEKIYEERDIEFSNIESKIYNEIETGQLDLEDDFIDRAVQVNKAQDYEFGALVFLEQACDSLELISEQFAGFESAKIKELETDLKELTTHRRVIVFTKYRRMIHILYKRFQKLNPLMYHGGYGQLEKQQIRDKFIFNPEHRILIVNLAAREGLDLHGDYDENNQWHDGADVMIFFDVGWNDGDKNQVEDRIHRIGARSDSVLIIRYCIKDSIDEVIWRKQADKDELFDKMVNERYKWEEIYAI